MRIRECPGAPAWLRDARVSEEDVSIAPSGDVVWHRGNWQDGTWQGGTWQGGTWQGGTWHDGTWCDEARQQEALP